MFRKNSPVATSFNRASLQKLQNKLNSVPHNKNLSTITPAIQSTTHNILKNLENKINRNFNTILTPQTIMPMPIFKANSIQLKENSKIIQGKKALMHHNNEKIQNRQIYVSQTQDQDQKQNQIPQKNITQNIKTRNVSSFNQMTSLQDQHAKYLKRQQQLKAYFYRYVVGVVDYQVQNDSVQYLSFQKINYKIWDEIQDVIKAIQRFCKHYEITLAMIQLKKVTELIAQTDKKKPQKQFQTISEKYHIHDLLGCLQQSENISQRNKNKKGIIFYGHKGKNNAIIKIQASMRRYLCKKKFKKIKQIIQKIIIIQRFIRLKKQSKEAKKAIVKNQIMILREFNQMQDQFKRTYRENELTKRVKYEIHISCHGGSQWQRISTPKFKQLQNTQICRIFRTAKDSSLVQTRVIYISPVPISPQIMAYYFKLLNFGNITRPQQRIFVLCPQMCNQDLLIKCSLINCLFYSSKTIKRIKRIIGEDYSYIVPSVPSSQYIKLCQYTKIPLYSSNPQPLLYLQSKSGFKRTVSKIMKESLEEMRTNMLPNCLDIYSQKAFLNALAGLISKNPYVRRWILNIDDELNSRGLAYCETQKIVPNSLLQSLKQENPQKNIGSKQKLQNHLEEIFFKNDRKCITIPNQQLYFSQKQYFQTYFSRGGTIQAYTDHLSGEAQNLCFCVEIEPDYNWTFVCNYKKITVNSICVGSLYPNQPLQPPLQIQAIVKYLINKRFFGFFTFQFLQISRKDSRDHQLYLHGIKCHLDKYCSAYFLREFIDKQNSALFIPLIQHSAIKQLRLQSFFKLCRLQNISFDIGRRIGNVFMFVDGLECGCMGMMSFTNGNKKQQNYQLASQVLDFFSSKVSLQAVKSTPMSFLLLRNAINGFLKKNQRSRKSKKILVQNSLKSL